MPASRSSAIRIHFSTVSSIFSWKRPCQWLSSSDSFCEHRRVGAERVVAAADDRVLERGDLVLGRHLVAVLEQRRVPVAAAVVDDRDERLAGHVAAEHEHVGLVVLRRR